MPVRPGLLCTLYLRVLHLGWPKARLSPELRPAAVRLPERFAHTLGRDAACSFGVTGGSIPKKRTLCSLPPTIIRNYCLVTLTSYHNLTHLEPSLEKFSPFVVILSVQVDDGGESLGEVSLHAKIGLARECGRSAVRA